VIAAAAGEIEPGCPSPRSGMMVHGSGGEVGRGDGLKEGTQVGGALGSKRRLELLLRLRPSLDPGPEASSTGLGQPHLFAPAIAAYFLDGIRPSRCSGRMFCPRIVRSMTRSVARVLIVIGPSRLSLASIENRVVRRPLSVRS